MYAVFILIETHIYLIVVIRGDLSKFDFRKKQISFIRLEYQYYNECQKKKTNLYQDQRQKSMKKKKSHVRKIINIRYLLNYNQNRMNPKVALGKRFFFFLSNHCKVHFCHDIFSSSNDVVNPVIVFGFPF